MLLVDVEDVLVVDSDVDVLLEVLVLVDELVLVEVDEVVDLEVLVVVRDVVVVLRDVLVDVLVEVVVLTCSQWQPWSQARPFEHSPPSHSSLLPASSTPSPQWDSRPLKRFAGVRRARHTPVISSHPDASVMRATRRTFWRLPHWSHEAVILVAFFVPRTRMRRAAPASQPLSIDTRF